MRSLDKFKILGLSDNTLKALREKGFEVPTPIQEKQAQEKQRPLGYHSLKR